MCFQGLIFLQTQHDENKEKGRVPGRKDTCYIYNRFIIHGLDLKRPQLRKAAGLSGEGSTLIPRAFPMEQGATKG